MRCTAHADAIYRCGLALAILILLLMMTAVQTQAQEEFSVKTEVHRLLNGMDLTQLQEIAPETDLEGLLKTAAEGDLLLDPKVMLDALFRYAKEDLTRTLTQWMRIMGIGLLSAGVGSIVSGREVGNLCEMAGCLCIALTLSAQTVTLLGDAKRSMQRMTDFTAAILPTLLALMTACGSAHSAAGLQRITLAATGSFARLFNDVLLTMITCAAVLTLVDSVMEDARLDGISKWIRNVVHWTVGACFAVFLGCIAVQGSTGAHFDGAALRMAKFAADKSVPIVGGLFKDASDTFVSCALIVKNALGVSGLAALVMMAVLPAVQSVCASAGAKLCAAMLQPFGSVRIKRILTGFADVLITIVVLITGAALMNLTLIAAMIHTGAELF